MAQNITLTIGGRPYKLVASSPESERTMRLAAEEVNSKSAQFSNIYPTTSELDKMVFTALTMTAQKIHLEEANRIAGAEVKDLCKRLDDYLDRKEI